MNDSQRIYEQQDEKDWFYDFYDMVPTQTKNGLNKLGSFIRDCYLEQKSLPSIEIVYNRLPKRSQLRKDLESLRFKADRQILYKYVQKDYSDDLQLRQLLYCSTIKQCRIGEWGDPAETVFFDIRDIMTGSGSEDYEMFNNILDSNGLPRYDPESIVHKLIESIGEKRICCMSSSPFIKEMWEWKGESNALCFPIDVTGLPFYKMFYSDEKIDPKPYEEQMKDMFADAIRGKASRKKVQSLYNEFNALTYLSICKKKTKRDDGIRWDVQKEYRMFPEKFESLDGKKDCFVSMKERVLPPITYKDYLLSIQNYE